MKLHNSDEMETILVSLTPDKTPIAYANRVKSLMDSGLTQSEAETKAFEPLEIELYYDTNAGLFGVEAEAVESGTVYNPYSGKLMDSMDDEGEKDAVIEKINSIIEEYGSFTTAEVEADHSPFIESSGNKLTHLAEEFMVGTCVVNVYDPFLHSSDEIDSYDEFYEEFELSQLEYILELAEKWKEINEE